MRIATTEHVESELEIESGPPLPHLAAYEVEVAGIERLREQFVSSELAHVPVRDGVVVRLPSSVGGTILFRDPAI